MTQKHSSEPQFPQNQRLDVALIESLIARLSHDFSNPIMIFNGVLEIIKRKHYKCTTHELKKYVNILADSSFRLNAQVKTLAYFNSQGLHSKNKSILQIIKKSISDLKVPPSVKISLPQNDVSINMDPDQIEMVMVTLIGNAVQAVNNRGAIMFRLTEYTDDIVLKIEDTGDGIPLEILPRLFDPTFLSRKIGSCFGLPMCKRIIENHNGNIAVDTNPFGTVFSLRLPKK